MARTPADLWPESRDARLYAGPWPVVAHPPCARWGRYWSGGPSAARRFKGGEDGGCFGAALASVRIWGGILEHPEGSHAWRAFRLPKPPRAGGWVPGVCGGWTCCVEQGHYGHEARKATWLYAYGYRHGVLPEFAWGQSAATAVIDDGFHTAEERRLAPAKERSLEKRLSHRTHPYPATFRRAASVYRTTCERANARRISLLSLLAHKLRTLAVDVGCAPL